MEQQRVQLLARHRSAESRNEITAVVDAVRSIAQSIRESGREAEQRFGISGAQLFILNELAREPAQSINSLAERTFTHQSSVSIVVSRLVERDLATRNHGRDDARRVGISITPAGRALVRRAPDAAQTKLVEALKRMPPAEIRALARNLRLLIDAIDMEQGEDESQASSRTKRA